MRILPNVEFDINTPLQEYLKSLFEQQLMSYNLSQQCGAHGCACDLYAGQSTKYCLTTRRRGNDVGKPISLEHGFFRFGLSNHLISPESILDLQYRYCRGD
jgi:hypothetical protein